MGWKVRGAATLGLLLVTGYFLLAVLPVILAWAQGLEPRPWRDDLASGLALAGFAMLLMEFLLSGRSRALSARVGMDRIMRFHQLMAYAVVSFVLLHPFLYSLPMGVRMPDDPDGAGWLQLPLWPGVTGMLAWLLLGALVFLAVVRDQMPHRYETWRLLHGLGFVAVALLGLHHTLETGRYSMDSLLAGVWVAATVIAVLSLVHVHLVTPIRQRRHPFRVAEVRKEAERTWTLEIEPDREAGHRGKRFAFRAGQFAWLKFHYPLFRITEHPFSISSAPAQWPRLAFTIKEAGDFTNRIGELPVGTPAFVDGPYGDFTLPMEDERPLIMIAGGVGMAPIMSLLRDLRARGDKRPIRVIQGNRIQQQILYAQELDAMAEELDLVVHHVLSEPPQGWPGPRGMPNEHMLASLIPESERLRGVYFVCGPPTMIDTVERTLRRSFGVPAGQVISERFRYGIGARAGSAGRMLAATGIVTLLIVLTLVLFAVRTG